MTKQQVELFWKIMFALQEVGLSLRWMVIGSWSEQVYEEMEILNKNWSISTQTRDIDFFIPSQEMKKSPLGDPIPLVSKMSELGFSYDKDRTTGVSRFFSSLLEVEFLTELRGDGQRRLPAVGKSSFLSVHATTGITPEPVRHLDILRRFPMPVCIQRKTPGGETCKINVLVSDPRAYIIQKMVINSERKDKQERDRLKIEALVRVMGDMDFSEILEVLSKKELSSVEKFCLGSKINLNMEGLFPEAQRGDEQNDEEQESDGLYSDPWHECFPGP